MVALKVWYEGTEGPTWVVTWDVEDTDEWLARAAKASEHHALMIFGEPGDLEIAIPARRIIKIEPVK